MKTITTICLVLFSGMAAQAQNPGISADQMNLIQQMQNMSPAEQAAWAQKMQAQATKASACFSQIDQAKMQALQIRGKKLSNEIDTLCAQGKDKEAERYAMREGKKMMKDKTVKHLQSCSKDMAKQFETMSTGKGVDNKNICGR